MSKEIVRTKSLGIFALAMINVAAVLTLRNFPSMAVYGWSSIGWYVIGTITFLIPLSPGRRGTRHRLAQGRRAYTPGSRKPSATNRASSPSFANGPTTSCGSRTVLAFIASTLAFAVDPDLASNGLYMFVVMMIIFWGTTLVALVGFESLQPLRMHSVSSQVP